MTFTEKFQTFVCEGDAIHCAAAGFDVTARIVCDDCPDRPDERDCGFWPSLYKDAPGFIGPGKMFRERFDEAQARAKQIMKAWEDGDWFYCGVVLSVARDGVVIDDHAASLWGVEANYPDTDNSYLAQVANDLLPEALASAEVRRAEICAALCADHAGPQPQNRQFPSRRPPSHQPKED